ncbi:hypothetical protein OF83DRAFT_1172969 [Amylostereum chailletii]|nr:hypothetical protein OF83DRAFT_1172969 [Amylostereum chailletii]
MMHVQSPVHRLPDDIIIEICGYIPNRSRNNFPSVALTLSHVCGSWRSALLHSKLTWAYIPLHNLKWTQIALERARPAPLTFEIRFGEVDHLSNSDAVVLALDDLATVHHFSIFYHPTLAPIHRKDDIFRLLSQPAPPNLKTFNALGITKVDPDALQHLFSGSLPSSLSELSVADAVIPDTWYAHAPPPHLRKVTLARCTLSPFHAVFSASLTHLDISEHTAWFTQDHYATLFRATPRLVSLSLVFSRPTRLHPSTEVANALSHLPHLESLEMRTTLFNIGIILEVLHMPLSTDIYLHGYDSRDHEPDNFSRLASALTSHFTPPPDTPLVFRTITVSGQSDAGYRFYASLPRSQASRFTARHIVPFKFEYSNRDGGQDNAGGPLLHVLTHLPISLGVQRLHLHSHIGEVDANSFHSLFGVLTCIDHVHVNGSAALAFASAFSRAYASGEHLFPALATLVLHEANFFQNKRGMLGSLQLGVFIREEKGNVPKSIELKRCGLSAAMLEVLRRALPDAVELIWEGEVYACKKRQA